MSIPGLNEARVWNILVSFLQDEKGKDYIRNHLHRFLKILELTPKDKPLSVLDLGTLIPFAALLRRTTPHQYKWHGCWEGDPHKEISVNGELFHLYNFDVEQDRFPFEDSFFDLVLCGEVVEHLGLDPFHLLFEINRVLRLGGQLILSTPNIASTRGVAKMLLGYSPYLYAAFTLRKDRHNREYCLSEVLSMMELSGFRADKFTTSNVYFRDEKSRPSFRLLLWIIDAIRTIMRYPHRGGDSIFVVASKIGPMMDRYPAMFYDIEDRP